MQLLTHLSHSAISSLVHTSRSAVSRAGLAEGRLVGACKTFIRMSTSWPTASSKHASYYDFNSRRSPVMGTRGMVASPQPLASQAGMQILQQGGNAADAAVAIAAALNVTEPGHTGLGGDCFALYYDAKTKRVTAICGNGKSPAGLTLEAVRAAGVEGKELPQRHAMCTTVPGTAAGWEDLVSKFGCLPLAQVLQPAIELAEVGFPVGPDSASIWDAEVLRGGGGRGTAALLPGGRAPTAGEVFRNPDLAASLKRVARLGAKEGFYRGPIADAIIRELQEKGGFMTHDDLEEHSTLITEPISTTYKGLTVYEVPPPTQGIAALLALNFLEQNPDFPGGAAWGSRQHLHPMLEAMRLAFADVLEHDGDPAAGPVPTEGLLSKEYAAERHAAHFSPSQAASIAPGQPATEPAQPDRGATDTVYFNAVDGEGNACSMINSNYKGFGTGIVPEGCGFSLQNRGHCFILQPGHPNCLAPRKRPYHTIIPAMATDAAGRLWAAFGASGGFTQPQTHFQVIVNMVDFGMEPQAALNAPRFQLHAVDSVVGPACVASSSVALEDGMPEEAGPGLEKLGHKLVRGFYKRSEYGRGQIIRRNPETGALWAGSDPRCDGQAIGW